MNPIEIEKIRKDFPYLDKNRIGKEIIYFDNGATTQKPNLVINSLHRYYSCENANPHRGAHYLGIKATELYENARQYVSKFLNADSSEEIVFVRNATEGLNLIAYAYALNHLKNGDEILLSILEHHSNLVTWQYVAKKTGAVLKYIYLTKELNLDMDDFRQKLTEKTKLLAVTGASNTLATMPDIRTMIQEAKRFGATTVIDAAQLAPHQTIDVQALDCDFLVFSGHKMYAPMGIGVLYGKKQLLEEMSPYQYGGDMIEYVYEQDATFALVPAKFEAGTQNVGGAIALESAIRFIQKIGIDTIYRHEKELAEYAYRKMNELDFVTTYVSQNKHRSPIIAFNIKDVHSHDVSSILDTYGIAIRTGHHCTMPLHKYLGLNSTCRASFAVYNTKEEIDFFVDKLREVRKVMGYGS